MTAQAPVFDLYRGNISTGVPMQYDHVCFARGGQLTPASSDGAIPRAGSAFYYLVAGANLCGEGPVGKLPTGVVASPAPCRCLRPTRTMTVWKTAGQLPSWP